MKKNLSEIFVQFILHETDSYVKKIALEQIEPLLVSQSENTDLIYDDFDEAKDLMHECKLQSSVAAYAVLVWKHAESVAKSVVIRALILHEPVLHYLIHWASVFLEKEKQVNLMKYIVSYRLASIHTKKEFKQELEALVLEGDTPLIKTQLIRIVSNYRDRQSESSIGIHTKFNWEMCWKSEECNFRHSMYLDNFNDELKRFNPFKGLEVSKITEEIRELNVIALVNAFPFALLSGVSQSVLISTLKSVMPKGLMPPTVLQRAAIACHMAKLVDADFVSSDFKSLINEMFTHKGVKKVPGTLIIGLDVSESMCSPITSNRQEFVQRRDSAVIMAYLLYLMAESAEIWLSGDSSRNSSAKHEKLSDEEVEELFSDLFKAGDTLWEIKKRKGFCSGGIYEYRFFSSIKKELELNPRSLPVENIFLLCDGDDCDFGIQIGSPRTPTLKFVQNQLVMNVQCFEREYGISHEEMFHRIWGNSDYFAEYFSRINGIANPMEKGDSAGGVSFRNQ